MVCVSVRTDATDPVQAIIDILSGASTTSGGYGLAYGYLYGGAETWTNAAPEVHQWESKSQEYREQNPDPALYVWSPSESDRPAFAGEYDLIDERQFVGVSVWTTSEQDVVDYAGDVVDLLEEYGTDNEVRTAWVTIRPSSENDLRAEKVSRRTDHYQTVVNVDLRGLRSTGLAVGG